MRRDMDLIRELMLRLEAMNVPPGGGVHFWALDEDTSTTDEDDIQIAGRSRAEINAHLFMIYDAGLARGASDGLTRMMSGEWIFSRLTPAGHDFIDAVRDVETWSKTKEVGKKAGGWTLDLLVDVGKAIIKGAAKEQLGKLGIPL